MLLKFKVSYFNFFKYKTNNFLASIRYVFLRLVIELDWDLNRPNKTKMINLSVKELSWQFATRDKLDRLPIQLTIEDRFLTNDVIDSLKLLTGSYPGGITFLL